MASLLQGLKDRVNAGSSSWRTRALSDSASVSVVAAENAETYAVVKAFKLQSATELKVVLSALILSECVYKLVDVGPVESAKAASLFVNQLPPGLVNLQHMQSVIATVPHRYMLGDDGQSLYVVFMGTKHMRDVLADANFLQEAVWKSEDPDKQQVTALAHRGFLARARGIPVEALYAHAARQGRRLVLCGHSLGGAVALLCTLRLLQGLPGGTPSLSCICFGTPAIGNAALAALVAEYGWSNHILNFILPEDIIPRILALPVVPARVKSVRQEHISSDQNLQDDGSQTSLATVPPTASVQAPMLVRSRLQNLRAILTARKATLLRLDSATGNEADAGAQNKPAHELADSTQQLLLDKSIQAASGGGIGLSGTTPEPLDQKQSSDDGSEQISDEVTAGRAGLPSRLHGFRSALVARWPTSKAAQQDEADISVQGSDLQQPETNSLPGSDRADQGGGQSPGAGKPVLQGIRSFTNRLPGFSRAQPVSGSTEQRPSSQSLPSALCAGQSSQPSADADQTSMTSGAASFAADELTSEQRQVTEANQGSRLWGLNNRVQGAWEGASSRVNAMRALLPAYPAYVHIGSHQILLPASPAMTEALKSAQQKGLAEERQQALIMHRMSAYRGRALAICRSVFHWEAAESAAQISLSTTLAPPITLIQATVIIPPLPLTAPVTSPPAEQPAQTLNQAAFARQSPSSQPLPVQHAQQLQSSASPQRDMRSSKKQQHVSWGQRLFKKEVTTAMSEQQPKQTGAVFTEQMQQVLLQPSQSQDPPETNGLLKNAVVREQEQQDPDQHVQGPLQQVTKQSSPGRRQKQRDQKQQSKGQLMDSSEATRQASVASPGSNTESKPGRWLPPVTGRWQAKQKQLPRVTIQIRVQGSVHGMPTKAQLQILGQHWCKAKLSSSTLLHSTAETDVLAAQELQESWRQKLFRRLPWLQPQVTEQLPGAQPDVMLVTAEVPVALLQAVVKDTEWQHSSPTPSIQIKPPTESDVERQASLLAQQKLPAMLLKLETDFLSKEQAVQVQLPVVWVLGADVQASQAVWQLLTSASLQTGDAFAQQDSDSQGQRAGSKPDSRWQAAQDRLRSTLTSLRRQTDSVQQPSQQQPQLVTAVMSGVQYALIRPTSMRYIDLLSCVLLVLSRSATDGLAAASQQQGQASSQDLSSRIRAAYHRQQLQQLQMQLDHLGAPSGIVLLHTGAVDAHLDHALSMVAKQASRMSIMRLGIRTIAGAASESLYGIPSDDWAFLPVGADVIQSDRTLHKLHHKLRGSLTAVMHSLGRNQSKL